MSSDATFSVCVVPIEVDAKAWSSGVSDATVRAVALADRLTAGGTVHLVHATPELTHFGLGGGGYGAWFPEDSAAKLDRTARDRAEQVLHRLAEQCPHVSVEFDVRPGDPHVVVLRTAERAGADGIVLPLSGHGALKRALLGSTADKLIRQASCPVLIVPS